MTDNLQEYEAEVTAGIYDLPPAGTRVRLLDNTYNEERPGEERDDDLSFRPGTEAVVVEVRPDEQDPALSMVTLYSEDWSEEARSTAQRAAKFDSLYFYQRPVEPGLNFYPNEFEVVA